MEAGQLTTLLERARSGDESVFRELYRLYRPQVLRLANGFASLDPDEAEDVVQETFVRAFNGIGRLQDVDAFERWLFTIARNRARSLYARKVNQHRSRDELMQEVPGSTPAHPPTLKLERDAAIVRQVVNELPEGQEKDTAYLFYVEGRLSAREIAEKLGVSKSAITMRLERFRARIKRELLRRVLEAQVE